VGGRIFGGGLGRMKLWAGVAGDSVAVFDPKIRKRSGTWDSKMESSGDFTWGGTPIRSWRYAHR